mmetsp:Transcript_6337/g.16881  ORF Transcript_6337/g.16881 Transcript_6337/m.16881 type:complete len:273 (+) Transcript_6337:748-1566(+)
MQFLVVALVVPVVVESRGVAFNWVPENDDAAQPRGSLPQQLRHRHIGVAAPGGSPQVHTHGGCVCVGGCLSSYTIWVLCFDAPGSVIEEPCVRGKVSIRGHRGAWLAISALIPPVGTLICGLEDLRVLGEPMVQVSGATLGDSQDLVVGHTDELAVLVPAGVLELALQCGRHEVKDVWGLGTDGLIVWQPLVVFPHIGHVGGGWMHLGIRIDGVEPILGLSLGRATRAWNSYCLGSGGSELLLLRLACLALLQPQLLLLLLLLWCLLAGVAF